MHSTALSVPFAGRTYKFHLGGAQLHELETGESRKHDDPAKRYIDALMSKLQNPDGGRGPLPQILRRLRAGEWTLPDVTETIRLALIGGGTPAAKAADLVANHVLEKPLAGSVQIAIAALGVALLGRQGET